MAGRGETRQCDRKGGREGEPGAAQSGVVRVGLCYLRDKGSILEVLCFRRGLI